MKREIVKRYSQALKQQVVREYESGVSMYKLQQKYGIKGKETVKRWIKQYGHAGLRSEVVIIQSVDDQLEFKAMQARIVELEAALTESVLDKRLLESTLSVASQSLGIDLKKSFGKPS